MLLFLEVAAFLFKRYCVISPVPAAPGRRHPGGRRGRSEGAMLIRPPVSICNFRDVIHGIGLCASVRATKVAVADNWVAQVASIRAINYLGPVLLLTSYTNPATRTRYSSNN